MVDAHRPLLAGPGWPLSVSHRPSSPQRGRPPGGQASLLGSSAHTTPGPGQRCSVCRVQSTLGTRLLVHEPTAGWPHWDPEKLWVSGSQRGQARVVACPVSEGQPSRQARSVRSQSWKVQPCSEAWALTAPQRAQPTTEAHPRLEGDRLLTGLSWQPPLPQWRSKWQLQRPQPRGRLPRPGPRGLLPQPQLSLGAASGCPVPTPHPLPTLSHTGPSPGAVGKCFRLDSRMTGKNLA